MKRIYLIIQLFILALATPHMVQAQYKSFFAKEEIWGTRNLTFLADEPIDFNFFYSSVRDSAVWNGKAYHKILHTLKKTGSPGYTIYAREDLDSGKVYLYDTAAGIEFLYIDISLNVGDTFKTNIDHSEPIYVYNVYYDQGLKHIQLHSNTNSSHMMWVEGVGAIFTRYTNPQKTISINRALSEQHLLCHFKDGKLFYINNMFTFVGSYCPNLLSVKDDNKKDRIKIYPNPAIDRLSVQGINTGDNNTIKIYDMMGRLQVEKNLTSDLLSITHISSGLYIVVIQNVQGEVLTRTQLSVER